MQDIVQIVKPSNLLKVNLSECTRVCWERKKRTGSQSIENTFNFSLLVFHFKTNPIVKSEEWRVKSEKFQTKKSSPKWFGFVLFGAKGGTWTHTVSHLPLKQACLPFHHSRIFIFFYFPACFSGQVNLIFKNAFNFPFFVLFFCLHFFKSSLTLLRRLFLLKNLPLAPFIHAPTLKQACLPFHHSRIF